MKIDTFPGLHCLHLTWPNGGVKAEDSEVADDTDYTLLKHPKGAPLDEEIPHGSCNRRASIKHLFKSS